MSGLFSGYGARVLNYHKSPLNKNAKGSNNALWGLGDKWSFASSPLQRKRVGVCQFWAPATIRLRPSRETLLAGGTRRVLVDTQSWKNKAGH